MQQVEVWVSKLWHTVESEDLHNTKISISTTYSIYYVADSCVLFTCLYRVQEDHPIMSFTVSKNGRLALLNVATQVSQLINFTIGTIYSSAS